MDDQELFEKVGQMRERALKNMPLLRSCVAVFIGKKITDEREIEKVLDTLLDYAMLDIGKGDFEKLNQYYRTVNQESADFYQRHYRDLLGF